MGNIYASSLMSFDDGDTYDEQNIKGIEYNKRLGVSNSLYRNDTKTHEIIRNKEWCRQIGIWWKGKWVVRKERNIGRLE